jgi:hypothetical protein
MTTYPAKRGEKHSDPVQAELASILREPPRRVPTMQTAQAPQSQSHAKKAPTVSYRPGRQPGQPERSILR